MLNKKVTRSRKRRTKSFLSKLYEILNEISYKDIIAWNLEGNGILIKNISSLCKIILPKYFKHNNYSSFIRQLNMYGFHKSRGIIKEGEGFEHEKFCKKVTKEQIKEIEIQNKEEQLVSEEIIANSEEDINLKKISQDSCKVNEFQLLFDNIEENSKILCELKIELKELSYKNITLNKNFEEFQNRLNGHSILLEKIMKHKSKDRINNIKNYQKICNITELFKKYLYHLKIYSPFVSISNHRIINKSRFQKENDIINYKNNMDIFSNNNDKIEDNLKESSFLKINQNLDSIELNLNDNDSSFSLLCLNKRY